MVIQQQKFEIFIREMGSSKIFENMSKYCHLSSIISPEMKT